MNMITKLNDLEVGFDVPALPGMREQDIQTPCLILDLDALEHNIKKMGDYAKALGGKLRAIRQQQGLSLHGVEQKSGGRWKAVVVGSYERGDRAVTVQRLSELAVFYGVPVSELLPDPRPSSRGSRRGGRAASASTRPARRWMRGASSR